MADSNPTSKFDTEALAALSTRLAEHANATLASKAAERDFRLASQVCDRLACLRFAVTSIAQQALDNPGWNNASLARDLISAVERVESGESV